jgi:hypothetical protein
MRSCLRFTLGTVKYVLVTRRVPSNQQHIYCSASYVHICCRLSAKHGGKQPVLNVKLKKLSLKQKMKLEHDKN